VTDNYTSQISLKKICSIPFDVEDIKVTSATGYQTSQ